MSFVRLCVCEIVCEDLFLRGQLSGQHMSLVKFCFCEFALRGSACHLYCEVSRLAFVTSPDGAAHVNYEVLLLCVRFCFCEVSL